ncbi:MAG: hypothetical protein KJ072_15090 [Verrucomicrobia bacterium]|nr:hypothetical protein [Verrucomicrobiota bacterium]
MSFRVQSFYADKSFAEWLVILRVQGSGDINYGDLRDTLWQIGAKATEALIEILGAFDYRAADTVAGLLGWEDRLSIYSPQPEREALFRRIRAWAEAGKSSQ